jgi:hypothetical protein
MVKGIDTFRQYFEAFQANYLIIGGTACDIIIEEAEFTTRPIFSLKANTRPLNSKRTNVTPAL